MTTKLKIPRKVATELDLAISKVGTKSIEQKWDSGGFGTEISCEFKFILLENQGAKGFLGFDLNTAEFHSHDEERRNVVLAYINPAVPRELFELTDD